jgi:hypothetical protein
MMNIRSKMFQDIRIAESGVSMQEDYARSFSSSSSFITLTKDSASEIVNCLVKVWVLLKAVPKPPAPTEGYLLRLLLARFFEFRF